MLFSVLFVCKCVLPLGDNPIAVNKYIISVTVAAQFKAWVCGRWPAEIVGSNPTGGMDVCLLCCVMSGRGLCDEVISRPEESYRLWCVVVCDLETSYMRRPRLTGGCRAKKSSGCQRFGVLSSTSELQRCLGRSLAKLSAHFSFYDHVFISVNGPQSL